MQQAAIRRSGDFVCEWVAVADVVVSYRKGREQTPRTPAT